jgi:hypothetical protein
MITDFDGVADASLLESTVRMLRARQHALSFVVPDAQSLLAAPSSRLLSDLHMVYSLSEQRRATEMRAILYKLGVPLVVSKRRIAGSASALGNNV